MSRTNFYLQDLDAAAYLAVLSQVAHADGLHSDERAMLEERANALGVSLDELPDVPQDLSSLEHSTRVLVYRDAFMLACVDDVVSDEERAYLAALSGRLALDPERAAAVEAWVRDYGALLERLDALLVPG